MAQPLLDYKRRKYGNTDLFYFFYEDVPPSIALMQNAAANLKTEWDPITNHGDNLEKNIQRINIAFQNNSLKENPEAYLQSLHKLSAKEEEKGDNLELYQVQRQQYDENYQRRAAMTMGGFLILSVVSIALFGSLFFSGLLAPPATIVGFYAVFSVISFGSGLLGAVIGNTIAQLSEEDAIEDLGTDIVSSSAKAVATMGQGDNLETTSRPEREYSKVLENTEAVSNKKTANTDTDNVSHPHN